MLPPEGVSVFDGSSSDFGSALSASSACSEKQVVYNRHLVDLPQKPHPLIVDLLENMDGEAWKKGILYGEILRKKYD